jgi:hypothetical protein
MEIKRKQFRCGWRTLGVLAVCMVEIGPVRVKNGHDAIEIGCLRYPGKQTSVIAAALTDPDPHSPIAMPSSAMVERSSPIGTLSQRRVALTRRKPANLGATEGGLLISIQGGSTSGA